MATTTESAQFLHLMAVMSPAFPIGSFAYSHGLEWAIDSGEVDILNWVTPLVQNGSAWNDAVLFSAAYDADDATRLEIDELAMALAASRERYLETIDLGQSFAKAASTLAGREALPYMAYTVVLAVYCADKGISKRLSLLAFMQAFSNNLIAVAVRLVPLGQIKGLEIMGLMMPVVLETVDRAMSSTLDDLGSSTLLSDIAAMKHETQYSRIFRS